MGVWLRANGRLEVIPPPDDQLLIEFWRFSDTTCPEDYRRMDEFFTNTWFFDEDNRLACISGKFAEPGIWLDWMRKHFFEPRGYEIIGDPDIIGEGDPGFDPFERESSMEYYGWLERISKISPAAAASIERVYGNLDERRKELDAWYEERDKHFVELNLT